MSILYCAIPHFAAALARRDDPDLGGRPLVLIGPDKRVLSASTEAAACGVVAGLTTRAAEVRCPEARLLDVDVARCQQEFETLLQVLEHTSPQVEPHGWGAAYVALGDLARDHAGAVDICQQVGRAVRGELGQALQPALGWDSSKFTAQTAARRTRPGHLLAVDASRERTFLQPLPVTLLPLPADALQRLGFLGLRTLGQYAALPQAAVGQQFGRAGMLAQRCARGEDDRPVVPRWQTPRRRVHCELDAPLAERERLLAALRQAVAPTLADLRGNLQACGQVRLRVGFDDGSTQERARTFLSPTAEEARVMRTLSQLLDKMCWQAAPSAPSATLRTGTLRAGPSTAPSTALRAWLRTGPSAPSATLRTSTLRTGPSTALRTGAVALAVTLEQIQDVVVEQLTLFPIKNDREKKLQEVQRYLAARFGANRLQRAVMAQPGAPLPEWRVGWVEGDEQ